MSKNDHKQIVTDQTAVDVSKDKRLVQNTDTELGTDADVSVGETETVLNEDGTAIHILAWRCVNSKADIRRRIYGRRIQSPVEKDRSLAAASHVGSLPVSIHLAVSSNSFAPGSVAMVFSKPTRQQPEYRL